MKLPEDSPPHSPAPAPTTEKLAVVRQYLVSLAACTSFVVVGTTAAWPSPMLPRLLDGDSPLHLDIDQASWVVSLYSVGLTLSSFPSGYLADHLGRRKTLLFVGLLPVVSWLMVLLTTSVATLCVARTLQGMFLGAAFTIVPIYIGEISQPTIRGSLSSLVNLSINIGLLSVLTVGPLVSYRTLASFALSISIVHLLLLFSLAPESPYYTIRNSEEKTKEILSWLRGYPNTTDLKIQTELDEIKRSVEKKSNADTSIAKVFSSRASRKALVIGVVYSAGKRLTGEVALKSFVTVTLPDTTFGVLTPNDCALILGITNLVSSLLVIPVFDLFGRKTMAVVSYAGCATSNFVVGTWFYLSSRVEADYKTVEYVPFIGLLFLSVSLNLGAASMLSIAKSEMFPTDVKSQLSAIGTISLGITAFVINRYYLVVDRLVGVYLNFFCFSGICVLIVLFVIIYVPETKGKTLKEIQDILNC